MRLFKTATIVIGLLGILGLSGCGIIQPNASINQKCLSSPVVYTNLNKPSGRRQYTLPNGQRCPILNPKVNDNV